MENQDQLHNWYKESFNKLSAEPPAAAWEAIAKALDSERPAPAAPFMKKWFGATVLVVITGAVTAWLFLKDTAKTPLAAAEVKQEQPVSAQTPVNNPSIPTGISTETAAGGQTPGRQAVPAGLAVIPAPEKSGAAYRSKAAKRKKIFSAGWNNNEQVAWRKTVPAATTAGLNETEPAGTPVFTEQLWTEKALDSEVTLPGAKQLFVGMGLLQQELRASVRAMENTPEIVAADVAQSGFYAGAAGLVNNTWILNYDTYNGLKRSELSDVDAFIAFAGTLSAGYRFSDKYSVQTEWLPWNRQGQKYKDYVEGQHISREVSLTYMQWNVLLKRRQGTFTYKNRFPVLLNILSGVHYGHLKAAEQTINHQASDISGNYRKSSYGLLLGMEYEAVVSKRVLVAAALRGNFGLNNVFAGNEKIPSHFLKTFNTSLGLQVGMNYLITGK